jgi:O-antigen/teichoic acid export membrane protein
MTRGNSKSELEVVRPPADVLDTPAAGGLVIRGAALRVLGYVAGALLATVSIVLLTRYLGVIRFGRYTTVISIVTVASTLTDLGMSGLATREYAVLVGVDREHFMRNLLGLRIAVSMVAVLLATAFAIAAGYDVALIVGTVLAALGISIGSLQAIVAAPLTAGLRLGVTSALELLRQAVLVGLTAILIVLGAGLLPLLGALLPAALVVLAATVVLARRHTPIRPSLRPASWLALARTTVAFSLATGVGTMYVFATQILTSLVATGHQNGLFAAAFRVFIVIASTAGLLVSAAFPLLARAARDDRDRLAYAVQRLFEVVIVLGVGAALTVVAGAKPIIALVAGGRYSAADAVLRIDAAALVASFVLALLGIALIALRRHREIVIANLLALVTTASLTLVLASTHGARGAAVATVCGEWVLCLGYMSVLFRGQEAIRPNVTVVGKVMLAGAAAFAVLLIGLPDVAQLALSLAVYGVCILLLNAIPRELYGPLSWHREKLT